MDADETSEASTSDSSKRAAEEAQRMAARALGRARSSGDPARRGKGAPEKSRRRRTSGSVDPQEVGAVLENFLDEQGWDTPAAIARLGDSWADIVGPEVAEHVSVESVRDGVVYLKADSTAWATQLRLLNATLLEQIQQALGVDVVTEVQVRGPQAPTWKAGPRVVKGRGPRDTYG